ncbi:MAG: CoA ester lyase [Gemmatimonadota bacterium]
MPESIVVRRCMLFVPADRPERFVKAVASGADAVCIDLEDAVAVSAKAGAREAALSRTLKEARHGVEVILRINDPKTELGRSDLDALCTVDVPPDAVLLPKAATAAEVSWVAGVLELWHPLLTLIPLIETARGLAAAGAIAGSTPNVSGIMFGAIDLSIELGCALSWDALLYARSRVVHAAALARVGALDVPSMAVGPSNGEQLAAEARAVRELGFTGKAAIHPSQVAVIQDAFSPSEAEIGRAARVIETAERSHGAAALDEGQLVDLPVVSAARRTLARVDAIRARTAARSLGVTAE